MNKRGQFYLLAAIVIVAIIIGLAGVMNYSKVKTDTKLIDLGEELGIEGGKVLEYGVYNQGENKVEDFAGKYDDYAGEDKNLFFIFGNSEGVFVLTYDEIIIGTISMGQTSFSIEEGIAQIEPAEILGNKIFVTLTDPETRETNTYEFELNPGENFYFVIFQKIGDEQHVVTG